MTDALVYLALLILIPATALNLFLLLRIIGILQLADLGLATAQESPVGKALSTLAGERLGDRESIVHDKSAALACAVVFLAAGCPKCKSRIAELERIDAAIEAQGHAVALWVVGVGTRRQLTHMLKGTRFFQRTLTMPQAERRRLNPADASPYYVFLDPQLTVQACNYLGDENWIMFVNQICGAGRTGDPSSRP